MTNDSPVLTMEERWHLREGSNTGAFTNKAALRMLDVLEHTEDRLKESEKEVVNLSLENARLLNQRLFHHREVDRLRARVQAMVVENRKLKGME